MNHLGLQCSFNLGCIDFSLCKVGKRIGTFYTFLYHHEYSLLKHSHKISTYNISCEYIAEKFTNEGKITNHQNHDSLVGGAEILASSLCVCDDDNDIPLALVSIV